MASEETILDVIEEISVLYPNQWRHVDPERLVDTWLARCGTVPDYGLKAALQRWIEDGKRFAPGLPDLIDVYHSLEREAEAFEREFFEILRPIQEKRAQLVEDYAAGRFVPGEWTALAERAERLGLEMAAAGIRAGLAGRMRMECES